MELRVVDSAGGMRGRRVVDYLRDMFAELERFEMRTDAGAGTLAQQRDIERAAHNRPWERFYDRCLKDAARGRFTFTRWVKHMDRLVGELVGTPVDPIRR